MGAYFTALIQQITAPNVTKIGNTTKPRISSDNESLITSGSNSHNAAAGINNNDTLDRKSNEDEESIHSEMNYNSPSPSESSLSVLSRHNDTENDNESENGPNNMITIQEEVEQENEFINHGMLHFQKTRDEWTKSSVEGDNDHNQIWEPMVIDDEEQEQIYKCIADEKPFPYNVPLEIMTEIMTKIWKQEQMLGYEISSKHAEHALALDRL